MADEIRVVINGVTYNALIVAGTGAGGGTAASIADGSDAAEGATTAPAYSDSTGAAAGTVVGISKGQYVLLSRLTNAGTGTSRSGTITTGGTAQQLAVANTLRRSLSGQNNSAGDLWINEVGGTAAVGGTASYRVVPGALFNINTNQAVSIIGATTGQVFAATEVQ